MSAASTSEARSAVSSIPGAVPNSLRLPPYSTAAASAPPCVRPADAERLVGVLERGALAGRPLLLGVAERGDTGRRGPPRDTGRGGGRASGAGLGLSFWSPGTEPAGPL